ncbi:hypothetical protein [Thermoactinospora rubra]|uniref:hypothetical protein n=1 Tax=Thermoactinospora rubra TaxID=1088767 RepID=UPI001301ACED|nr:hypothetical protein [Thermoactinospora rubra]
MGIARRGGVEDEEGASTASQPITISAIAVCGEDQPRSSCRQSVTMNWKPKNAARLARIIVA